MKTKVCSKCKKEKDISEFTKCKKAKDGLQYLCKECNKKRSKNYYQNNIDKVKKQNREYWRKNRERSRENSREYRQKNKEYCRASSKKWRDNNPIKVWCSNTIRNHKQRGYKVLFIAKELYPIAQKTKNCSMCDNPLKYGGKKQNNTASLDRKDNGNILTLNNTQIICLLCNASKQNRTMKEFIEYCEMVYQKFGTLVVIPINLWIKGEK